MTNTDTTAKIYSMDDVLGINQRIERLEAAIRTHRDQKADDRCIEDDDRLYEVLGDGIKCDRRVGCQMDMMINCIRFIRNRTQGGGWSTYVELEAEVKRLRESAEGFDEAVAASAATMMIMGSYQDTLTGLLNSAGIELELCQSPLGSLPVRREARHALIETIRSTLAEPGAQQTGAEDAAVHETT